MHGVRVVMEGRLMPSLLSGPLAAPAVPPIRVLLVDDSAEFLDSAARFLATDPAITVAGRAQSGAEAIEQIAALAPDLVLVDITMPELSGLQMTSLVKSRPNAPRVIVLTLYDVAEYAVASQAVHADGYVAKVELSTSLLPMIHTLFDRPS
jgi:DNA-binding NarL/FixJ family response regulator